MKKICFILLFLLGGTNVAVAGHPEAAMLYIQKRYDEAYNMLLPLAEQSNDAQSQYLLGLMYLKGQGVEQDYEEAGKWFRKASEQSLAVAQYKLARLYTEGNGVPQDSEFAYVWLSVGAAHQHHKSMKDLDTAREQLSEEEIAEAEKIIPEYIKKFGPKPKEDKNKSINLDK